MKNERRKAADERLRRLLRRGDPAGDGAVPSPVDVARMRRTILAAASEAPRPRVPALVPVGAAALLVALAFWVLKSGSARDARPLLHEAPQPATIAATPDRHPSTPGPPAGSASPARPGEPVSAASGPDVPALHASATPAPSDPAPGAPQSPPAQPPALAASLEPGPRSIRFVTSNGTQIIWTLDPQLEI
jgi:hypothetical protein